MSIPFHTWLAAARPRTLSASIVPVALGVSLAIRSGVFRPWVAAMTLTMALLIQIGTNLANDYYDFVRGADGDDRLGPERATQSGVIPATTVRNAAFMVLAAAALCSASLVAIGGIPILVIGIASIVSALAYTAGPYPLAYHGFGDLFVFVFFGPVAVCGTYYLQTANFHAGVAAASLPVAALAAAIMAVNNLRDIATDSRAGKNTLAVRIGDRATRAQYVVLVVFAFVVQSMLAIRFGVRFAVPLLVLPLAAFETALLLRREGAALNSSLGGTARLLLVFGIAAVGGLIY